MFGQDRIRSSDHRIPAGWLGRLSSHMRFLACSASGYRRCLLHSYRPNPRQWLGGTIWSGSPSPGQGRGGGSNKTPVAAPAREVGKEKDCLTVPTTGSEPSPVEKPKEDPPTHRFTIPAKPMADASESLPGVVEPAPSPATTQRPGAAEPGRGPVREAGTDRDLWLGSRVRRRNRRRCISAGRRHLTSATRSRTETGLHGRRDAHQDARGRASRVPRPS